MPEGMSLRSRHVAACCGMLRHVVACCGAMRDVAGRGTTKKANLCDRLFFLIKIRFESNHLVNFTINL